MLAGGQPVAAAEWAPFQLRVLRHRIATGELPPMRLHEDVRAVRGADYHGIDVVAGGFPCTDISAAGRHAGLEGNASGLWREVVRIADEAQPRFVFLENSDRLIGSLGIVLGAFAGLGFCRSAWSTMSAAQVGAPHLRNRLWVLLQRTGDRRREMPALPPRLPSQGMVEPGRRLVAIPPLLPKVSRGELPTITVADSRGSGNRPNPHLWTLSDVVGITRKAERHGRMLPTLVATDWKGAYRKKGLAMLAKEAGAKSANLRDVLPILEGGAVINPDWAGWFQGWPPLWTDLSVDDAGVPAWRRATAAGKWWSDAEESRWLPRTLESRKGGRDVKARIETLGNAQVPLVAATAFTMLREILK
jgi:site-specific DNA-cytosine methylase